MFGSKGSFCFKYFCAKFLGVWWLYQPFKVLEMANVRENKRCASSEVLDHEDKGHQRTNELNLCLTCMFQNILFIEISFPRWTPNWPSFSDPRSNRMSNKVVFHQKRGGVQSIINQNHIEVAPTNYDSFWHTQNIQNLLNTHGFHLAPKNKKTKTS